MIGTSMTKQEIKDELEKWLDVDAKIIEKHDRKVTTSYLGKVVTLRSNNFDMLVMDEDDNIIQTKTYTYNDFASKLKFDEIEKNPQLM